MSAAEVEAASQVRGKPMQCLVCCCSSSRLTIPSAPHARRPTSNTCTLRWLPYVADNSESLSAHAFLTHPQNTSKDEELWRGFAAARIITWEDSVRYVRRTSMPVCAPGRGAWQLCHHEPPRPAQADALPFGSQAPQDREHAVRVPNRSCKVGLYIHALRLHHTFHIPRPHSVGWCAMFPPRPTALSATPC